MSKPKVGDVVERDGSRWRVVAVWAIESRYDGPGHRARTIGWGLGLAREGST